MILEIRLPCSGQVFEDLGWLVRQSINVQRSIVWLPLGIVLAVIQVECNLEIDDLEVHLNSNFQAKVLDLLG